MDPVIGMRLTTRTWFNATLVVRSRSRTSVHTGTVRELRSVAQRLAAEHHLREADLGEWEPATATSDR